MAGEKTTTTIDGRLLTLSNLDKNLYPAGFTKAEVIDYYARVAPALLPHLAGRPSTRKRYPNGTDHPFFFEKNVPRGKPRWVRTVTVASPGSSMDRDTVDYVIIDDLPTLVWCANLAALELHIPQWRAGPSGEPRDPDLMVFDLDPGPGTGYPELRDVALMLRDLLAGDGLASVPKTSGSKGLHLYVPLAEVSDDRTTDYALRAALRLEQEHPSLVLSKMERKLRPGKIFVDWSQNRRSKTTVAAYSLRAGDTPLVSTPLTWDELASADELPRFAPHQVLDRVKHHGDLLAPLLTERQSLP